MLFLFSEVGEQDAPTRIRVGSHLDVPQVLETYGEDGASGLALAPELVAASDAPAARPRHRRPRATSSCATRSWCTRRSRTTGRGPRFMAQPPLMPAAPYELERADGAYSRPWRSRSVGPATPRSGGAETRTGGKPPSSAGRPAGRGARGR